MKGILCCAMLFAAFGAFAFDIDFESPEQPSVGVYDTWTESPFMAGRLEGNVRVLCNHLAVPGRNESAHILGVQRSRCGSNTFGARIDLQTPLAIGPDTLFVHALIHKPVEGRVMLIGLGHRTDSTDQRRDVEQVWTYPLEPVTAGEWNDAVFPVRANRGVVLESLVIVPDCEDPGRLDADFAAYIDEITVSDSSRPRFRVATLENITAIPSGKAMARQDNRNGEILFQPTGAPLDGVTVDTGTPLAVRLVPSGGFAFAGLRVHSRGSVTDIPLSAFDAEGVTVVPGEFIDGEVVLEGIFEEVK